MPSRPLHILAADSSDLALSGNRQLVKAMLLYGDAVTLCSLAASFIARVLPTPPKAALDTFIALADDFDLGDGLRELADARVGLIAERDALFRSERIERSDPLPVPSVRQREGCHRSDELRLAELAGVDESRRDLMDAGV